jgi:hypothetical protein
MVESLDSFNILTYVPVDFFLLFFSETICYAFLFYFGSFRLLHVVEIYICKCRLLKEHEVICANFRCVAILSDADRVK